MATFGYTTVGGSSGGYLVNVKEASRAVLSEAAGSVTKITARIRNDGGACNVRLALYADSSDVPGALVAQTNAVAVAASAAAAWVDFAFASAFSLAAGTYWIAIMGDGDAGGLKFYFDFVDGNASRYANDTYSDGFADPFGASSSDGTLVGSFYVTYTTAAAGNPAYYFAQN